MKKFLDWIDVRRMITAFLCVIIPLIVFATWDFFALALSYGPRQVQRNAEQLSNLNNSVDKILRVLLTVQGDATIIDTNGTRDSYIRINDFSAASIYGKDVTELRLTNLTSPMRTAIIVKVDAHYTSEDEDELCRISQRAAARIGAFGEQRLKVRLSPVETDVAGGK